MARSLPSALSSELNADELKPFYAVDSLVFVNNGTSSPCNIEVRTSDQK
jgi:hypothetical protein